MAITLDYAKEITEMTIGGGLRHVDYERNVEIARKCFIYVTGEGQDTEYLIHLRDKETERQKEIRVKVTKPITTFAVNPVKTQYEKMFRVDGVSVQVEHQDSTATLKINDAIETFYGNAGLRNYLEKRYLHYQFLDPNAWLITERRNQKDENGVLKDVDVYPFEVSSEQAINYDYDNGIPQWLIVEQKRVEVIAEKETELSTFYFYAAGIALKYREQAEFSEGQIKVEIPTKDEPRYFAYSEFSTGSQEFPGHKWGSYDGPERDSTVKVPPFWQGRHILDDLIETKSIFDVSRHNHVFPKLFHYDKPCEYRSANGSTCNGGYLDEGKTHVCPSCHGSGGILHISESDVITLALPDIEDGSKVFPLSQMAYYHQPPLDVTKELYQYIKDFIEWFYFAAFNTSNVQQQVVQRTATEVDKLWDEINTRVYPCAVHLSRLFEKTVRVAAQYLEVFDKEKIKIKHVFPMDMRLEPLDVLIDRYQRAKNAGVSYDVLWAIHCMILGKTFIDSPKKVEEIKAWEEWKPFKSYDENLALTILQDRASDDPDKVLYENWDTVKQLVTLALKGVPFSEVPRERQKSFVDAAVTMVSANIKLLGLPEPMPNLTTGITDDEPQPSPQN